MKIIAAKRRRMAVERVRGSAASRVLRSLLLEQPADTGRC